VNRVGVARGDESAQLLAGERILNQLNELAIGIDFERGVGEGVGGRPRASLAE
jgi:hypothetical protein